MELWQLTFYTILLIGFPNRIFSVPPLSSVAQLCRSETIIIPLNVTINDQNNGEFDQSNDVNASVMLDNNSNSAECDCHWESSAPWGQILLKIICQEKQFENHLFDAEELPPLTQILDLSWNRFEFVPQLHGNDLIDLDISHNVIKSIDENNFAKVESLKILNLESNEIQWLSINGFAHLKKLEMLNLAKNQLRMITINVFSPLIKLRHLILSQNKHLNDTFGERNINLYLSLGVVPSLEILEIDRSNLDFIDLLHAVGLRQLHLKGNAFVQAPDIPRGLELLDLSHNYLTILEPNFLPHLGDLHTLLLNDMPHLIYVEEYAFYGLPSLKHLSFQGSWNLTEFNAMAFGSETTDNVTAKLEVLNLRGTGIRTLNATLAIHLTNVRVFDLNGNPLKCDCSLNWINELGIETGGKCVKPLDLRGRRLSNLTFDQLKCKHWPLWVYTVLNGALVFVLLIISIVCTWFLVMGLKPLKNIRSHHKVGMTSPYARITIEPNRSEEIR